MKNVIGFDVVSLQAAAHGNGILKVEATLDAGAAAVFVQLHDSYTTPAVGSVPLKSWPVVASTQLYKEFKSGELRFADGVFICVSTTEATLTIGTGNNKFDMVATELEDPDMPSGTTMVGDDTTNTQALEVWAESAGPKKLFYIRAAFGAVGATKYLMLFAHDSPTTGDVPLAVLASGDGSTVELFFGVEGMNVMSVDSDGVLHQGCSLAMSITQATLTAGSAANRIRAEYK